MPHNIEKSAFRAGEYVGYGRGRVWRIRRDGKAWRAMSDTGEAHSAATLLAISALIERN